MPSVLRGVVEVKSRDAVRVLAAGHRHRRGELDRLHRQAGDRAPADLAVGHVEEFRGRGPRGAEREHVLVAGDRLAVDLEARLPAWR